MTVDRRRRHAAAFAVLAALAAAALVGGIATGSAEIPLRRVLAALWADDGSPEAAIVRDLRLPRTLTAFGVGGLLAVAGALMQVLLRNPLGDPYILGVSGGAAAAVLGGAVLGLAAPAQPAVAFVGALASMLLVFALGRPGSEATTDRLLLTGVVVASGWAALISFALSLAPPGQLPGMLFFLMGDLADASTPWLAGLALGAGLLAAFALGRDLDLLALGDLRAAALGVDVRRLRFLIYALSSLLTAVAVSTAGGVGFVGLVAPHMVRIVGGSAHRWVLPAGALLGGALLTLADTLARVAVAPRQLPAGVLTALLGVPAFLFLLHRRR